MANETPSTEATVSSPTELDKIFPTEETIEKAKAGEDAGANKSDVKEIAASSSEDADPKEDELHSQVEALQKELARVRRTKNDSAEEVQGLRESLARVQGQLETLVRGTTKTENKMGSYTDAQLVQGQAEWEDEILDIRDALREARKTDDHATINAAQKQYAVAKHTLAAIRQELLDRTKRVGADQARAQGEATKIVEEVVELYDTAYEHFPDLKDKDSDIWQAGNEEYTARPSLMKQLGPLGELVAVALAITNKPELVGGKKQAKAARRELLSEINDKAEAALLKGGGKAKAKTPMNFAEMKANDFESIVNKIKMGG